MSDNAFKITLPNWNYTSENDESKEPMDTMRPDERRVLKYILSHDLSARAEIESTLELSQSQTIRELKRLLQSGLIEKVGEGKNTRYSVIK